MAERDSVGSSEDGLHGQQGREQIPDSFGRLQAICHTGTVARRTGEWTHRLRMYNRSQFPLIWHSLAVVRVRILRGNVCGAVQQRTLIHT